MDDRCRRRLFGAISRRGSCGAGGTRIPRLGRGYRVDTATMVAEATACRWQWAPSVLLPSELQQRAATTATDIPLPAIQPTDTLPAILTSRHFTPMAADADADADAGVQLLQAVASGDLQEIRRLLAAGAPIGTRDGQGRTALLLAVDANHVRRAPGVRQPFGRNRLAPPSFAPPGSARKQCENNIETG